MNLKRTLIVFSICMKSILSAFSTYEISNLNLEFIQDIVESQATCINNKGEVAGGLFVGGGNIHHSVFLWTKESGLIELFPNNAYPPSDMNDLTQLVGYLPNESDSLYSYFWTLESGLVSLKPFRPKAINDSGIMVGINKWNHNFPTISCIKYPLEDPHSLNLDQLIQLNKIYTIETYSEHPKKINNKCEVIGSIIFTGRKSGKSEGTKLHSHGFLWKTENECIDFGNQMIPNAINDFSQVVLVSDFSEKGISWFWENGKISELWDSGLAQAINNEQIIVGARKDNAVIWEKGQLKDLIDLVVNKDGWDKLTMALDINDRREVVGRGIYKGKQTGFLLTPFED